jgi:hypothetical protein
MVSSPIVGPYAVYSLTIDFPASTDFFEYFVMACVRAIELPVFCPLLTSPPLIQYT